MQRNLIKQKMKGGKKMEVKEVNLTIPLELYEKIQKKAEKSSIKRNACMILLMQGILQLKND